MVIYENKFKKDYVETPFLFFRRTIKKVRRSQGRAFQDKASKDCFGIKAK
jgi:hypothetical protein